MTTAQPSRNAPKRSRARTVVPLAIAAWVVLEIWLFTVVADLTGGPVILLLLVGAGVLGAAVMKRAGRRAFRNLSETMQRRQQHPGEPAEERPAGTGNGFLMLGGLLILLPGLISDAIGLILLLPPVRKMLGRRAERSWERRMRAAPPGSLGDAYQQARMHQPDGKVVQGEVIREDHRTDGEPRGRSGEQRDRPPLTP